MIVSGAVNYLPSFKICGPDKAYIVLLFEQWSARVSFPILRQPCLEQEYDLLVMGRAPEPKDILPISFAQYREEGIHSADDWATAVRLSGALEVFEMVI